MAHSRKALPLSPVPRTRWFLFGLDKDPPAGVSFTEALFGVEAMPRKKLPAEYDIGFLCLHSDGTIAATFRFNRLYKATDRLEVTADRHRFATSINRRDSEPLTLAEITAEDLDIVFPEPKRGGRAMFSGRVTAAWACNTATGFKLVRHNGISWLKTWRSGRFRTFVHERGSWIETDVKDTRGLLNSLGGDCHDEGIPF